MTAVILMNRVEGLRARNEEIELELEDLKRSHMNSRAKSPLIDPNTVESCSKQMCEASGVIIPRRGFDNYDRH